MLKNTQKDSHSTIKADELIKAVFFSSGRHTTKNRLLKSRWGFPVHQNS